MDLQARGLKDPAQAELLKESQSRIKTMSIVHEKLYRSGDLSRIDFSDYIESLAVHLDGTIELIREGGTEFRIVFREQVYKPRF